MKRRPLGVTILAVLCLLGAAGYAALLFAWLFARGGVTSFIEQATPSASLGPALLLEIPGVVTAYFIAMAGFCCWCGVALLKLHRWAWFATCAFAILSFALDVTLFAHMFRHLSASLLVVAVLRFAFLIWIVAYLSRTKVRAAFGLARRRVAA